MILGELISSSWDIVRNENGFFWMGFDTGHLMQELLGAHFSLCVSLQQNADCFLNFTLYSFLVHLFRSAFMLTLFMVLHDLRIANRKFYFASIWLLGRALSQMTHAKALAHQKQKDTRSNAIITSSQRHNGMNWQTINWCAKFAIY